MKISFVFLLCAVTLVRCDLNDVKKLAVKKCEGFVENIKKLADDTSLEVDKRTNNIKIITKHEREFGDGIIDEARFEITKTAKSAYMMANLLGSPNSVFRCIEYREREGIDDTDIYYSQKFLDVGRDYEMKSEEYQRNLIKSWKDDYYRAIEQYGRIYQTTLDNIKKATTESQVSSNLKQFENVTNQMSDIIVSILPNLNKCHIQVLKLFSQLIEPLQKYAKYRVEETTKVIYNCFPKLFDKTHVF